jgi:hypothetical protein
VIVETPTFEQEELQHAQDKSADGPQVDEDKDEIEREFLEKEVQDSFLNLLNLAKQDKIPLTMLRKVKRFFERPKTPAAATAIFVDMYQSCGSETRRGSYTSM